MKSLPFKEGLDEWKRTKESIEFAKAIINPPKIEQVIIPYDKSKTQRKAERVIHGEVSWKPIDKAASMLLSKAPWWAHPIPDIKEIRKIQNPEIEPKKKKPKKHKCMNDKQLAEINPNFNRNVTDFSTGQGERLINIHEIAVLVIDQINKQKQELTPLARAALDARGVLDENLKSLGGGMEDFKAKVKVALEEIRQTRFACVAETSQMMTPLKEIRQFFMGSDYKEELARLREFVDLCERLQKLKQSGILDAIGDTMIKLAQ